MKIRWWWFVHNTLVHPWMGVFPNWGIVGRLHDWSAGRAADAEAAAQPVEAELGTAMVPAVVADAPLLVKLMGLHESVDRFREIAEGQFELDGSKWLAARAMAIERLETMVSEHFSDEDIIGLIHFYSSPLGQRMTANMLETSKKVESIVFSLLDE